MKNRSSLRTPSVAAAAAVTSDSLSIKVPASAFIPRATNGPGEGATETVTHLVPFDTQDFDNTTSEASGFDEVLPSGGTFQFKVFFTVATGGSGTVTFRMSGRALTDGDTIDQAYGTAQSVAKVVTGVGAHNETDWSPAVTLAGVPAAGKLAQFLISRDVATSIGADARVRYVLLRFAP